MFLSGVIEGFYGPPWTQAERLALFDRMSAWDFNTYLYCPKDDLHHRTLWREPYSAADADVLGQLIDACAQRGIRFMYGLGPGLDIRYSDAADTARLHAKFAQLLALGCRHVALLFDDIPDRLDPADLTRWGSLAAAQCHVTNTLFTWLKTQATSVSLAFCPTPYCGRMAAAQLGGPGYLATVGTQLAPDIDIFWTGPEIISREISVPHVRELQEVLQRKPLLWDNLHANDYDSRRLACGPYAGRPPELRHEVRGLLSNPNSECLLNYVPLHTLAALLRADGPWDARAAYLAAMHEWLPAFATVGGPTSFDDLVLLGDCHYLPHEEGPAAEALYSLACRALSSQSATWRDDAQAFLVAGTRLRAFLGQLATLRDRPLFHALSRRVWDLREEVDLLVRCVETRLSAQGQDASFRSDFHLPGTYRGGMVARLQRLLIQHPDGTFTSALTRNPKTAAGVQ